MFGFPISLIRSRAPNTTRLLQGPPAIAVLQLGRPLSERSFLRWDSFRHSQYGAGQNVAPINKTLSQQAQKHARRQSALDAPLALPAVKDTSQEDEMLNTPVKQAKRGRWSELEDQEILKLLRSSPMPDNKDIEAIARKLGRSVDSVELRIRHLRARLQKEPMIRLEIHFGELLAGVKSQDLEKATKKPPKGLKRKSKKAPKKANPKAPRKDGQK